MTASARARLRHSLHTHEGVRLKPYTDTKGKWTIGIGRNLTDRGISRIEAEFLLDNDITQSIAEAVAEFPWIEAMSEPRQAVLVEMIFNMGLPKVRGFKNTLKAMQAGEYELAAVGMLSSKWADDVGRRALTLATQMRSGRWAFESA